MPSAFQQLLRPHVDFLYRLAVRFTGVAADAEDLVQDTLIKLLPRTAEMQAVEQLRPWLARVLHRQFIDLMRKRGRTPSDPSVADGNGDETLGQLLAMDDGPEASAERSLQYGYIVRALDQLNPDQRVVIAMHDVEGYSLEELEGILESPIGTLKSRLHRARNRLRVLLQMEPFSAPERVRERVEEQ